MIDWGRELKVSNETDLCVHQETLSQELLNTNTELINKLTMNRALKLQMENWAKSSRG